MEPIEIVGLVDLAAATHSGMQRPRDASERAGPFTFRVRGVAGVGSAGISITTPSGRLDTLRPAPRRRPTR